MRKESGTLVAGAAAKEMQRQPPFFVFGARPFRAKLEKEGADLLRRFGVHACFAQRMQRQYIA